MLCLFYYSQLFCVAFDSFFRAHCIRGFRTIEVVQDVMIVGGIFVVETQNFHSFVPL